MESLQAHLLIATRELQDPNFAKTVVLMVKHDDEGALGLILNRPTSASLKEIWSQLNNGTCAADHRLHLGGPIQGPLMVVHGDSELSEIDVMAGVHFTHEPSYIEQLVDNPDLPARFFIGYSGWAPGQLEHELKQGSWLTAPADPQQVFASDETLWEEVSKRLADRSIINLLNIKHVPPDSSMN